MSKAARLADIRTEIGWLERQREAGLLHPAGRARLKNLKNRLAQERVRLPLAIAATREKLRELEAAYYG